MPLNREMRIVQNEVRKEGDDLIVEMAFASETPYERWWGTEVLTCRPEAVRMDRMNDGASLLFNHNWDDLRGVIVKDTMRCDPDYVMRGDARITSATEKGREAIALVESEVLTKTSVSYQIYKIIEETKTKAGEKSVRELDGAQFMKILDRCEKEHGSDVSHFHRSLDKSFGTISRAMDEDTIYRVMDWEPLEQSLVTVPADPTVGVNRSANAKPNQPQPDPQIKEIQVMSEPIVVDVEAEKHKAHKGAMDVVNEILALGKAYKCQDLASEAIQAGKSIDQFKSELIEKMANKPLNTADIGLTIKEAKSFSIMRAINALSNPGDRKAQEQAAFERECSDAFGRIFGKAAQGFYIPLEVQRRDLLVGTSTAGGHTVATDLLGGSFIDVLRNRMQVLKMGAQILGGLTGHVAIPRQTGGATVFWVAENGNPTESQQAFDQVTMTPKTMGAFTDISRRLLLQSSIDVEQFVQNDLATVLALEQDRVAINGSGASNQPLGILNTSGIGDVAGGINGLAPTWANVVELWSDVAVANADFGATGILTNSKVVGKLMATLKAPAVAGFIAENFPGADGFISVSGLRTGVSNQVPSNLTKGSSSGVCSALIQGNWNDLIIGEWGSLDLTVDPYTGSTAGTVRVVVLKDIDVAVRHPESFSAMKDALTV